MLYCVFINDKGFIETFSKFSDSYTTTLNMDDADFTDMMLILQTTSRMHNH